MPLSDQQFQGLAGKLATEGGFSASPKTGRGPSSGFMVGVPGHELVTPSASTTGATIKGFAEQEAPALGAHGAHLGGWRSGGEDSFDVSKRFPPTPAGHSASRAALVKGNQDASYVVHKDAEEFNPFSARRRDRAGMEPHELADMAAKSPQKALKQPEVQAWVKSPKKL